MLPLLLLPTGAHLIPPRSMPKHPHPPSFNCARRPVALLLSRAGVSGSQSTLFRILMQQQSPPISALKHSPPPQAAGLPLAVASPPLSQRNRHPKLCRRRTPASPHAPHTKSDGTRCQSLNPGHNAANPRRRCARRRSTAVADGVHLCASRHHGAALPSQSAFVITVPDVAPSQSGSCQVQTALAPCPSSQTSCLLKQLDRHARYCSITAARTVTTAIMAWAPSCGARLAVRVAARPCRCGRRHAPCLPSPSLARSWISIPEHIVQP